MSLDKLRILNVIDNLAPGGTQNLALRTMQDFRQRGAEVGFLVLGHSARTQTIHWKPDYLEYLEHPADYRKPWQLWSLVRRLRKQIEQFQPTILHSWLWTSDYVTAKANGSHQYLHMSHIVDRRNWLESPLLRHRIRRWATQRAFRKSSTQFFAVSDSAKQFAVRNLGLSSERITVALNSIDPLEFGPTGQSGFLSGRRKELVVGIASRLEPEKGHRFLLLAIQAMRKEGLRIRLVIAGQGGNRKELENLVRELGIEDGVDFLGFVDSVPSFLANIDVFAVPSIDSEGLPTTILEAMACQRLVVVSDVGGATEAVIHQKTGYVVPPGDVNSLASVLRQIFLTPHQSAQIVHEARSFILERFTVAHMCKTIATTYQNALQQFGSEKSKAQKNGLSVHE
jgi:glycosyltransferase involved in cell wall biosynthesis